MKKKVFIEYKDNNHERKRISVVPGQYTQWNELLKAKE